MHELTPLIEMAKASTHSHVVIMMDDRGFRWRLETERACSLMAEILSDYGAKVMTREDFISSLQTAAEEESK